MAERKATNKYYPPDWDPSKGSINRHTRSHPLRDRAKKIGEGILIVRFEMPFNIWCLKCENHIGMGVRYNAEKSKVGNYYSSPIYRFKMKCHLCENHFEIQTDPAKFDYLILSGARKQARSDPTDNDEDLGQVAIDSDESRKRMTDAMFRLEKKVEDKINSEAQLPSLHELKDWRSRWEDSFAANQLVRAQFRQRRKRLEHAKEKNKKLLQKSSLKIRLVKSNSEDRKLAKELSVEVKHNMMRRSEESRRLELLNSPLIPKTIKKEQTTTTRSGSQLNESTRSSNRLSRRIKRDPG